MSRKAKHFILSMDGGGIRGIIPLRVLEALDGRLRRAGVTRPLHQIFSLICGTSASGLVAAALAAPRNGGAGGEAAGTLSDLRHFFEVEARELFTYSFSKRLGRFVTNPLGLFDERYDARPLERMLKDRFGWTSMASALTHVMLPAYDIERRNLVMMSSAPGTDGARPDDYYFWEAVRASMAEPSFFEPARIDNLTRGCNEAMISGSAILGNPSMAAYAQARRMGWAAEDIVVISLGTGHAGGRAFEFGPACRWGALGWMLPSNGAPLLSVLQDGHAAATAGLAEQVFADLDGPAYYRFDGELPPEAEEMDNGRPGNLILLNGAADRIIRDQTLMLDELAALIAASCDEAEEAGTSAGKEREAA